MTEWHWRPIETVPDEQVLLFFPQVQSGRNSVLHQMMQIGYARSYPSRQPSHWMPLPGAPRI